MAIRPNVELLPNVTGSTASFPLGSSKNETAPGVNDGTPYNLTRANDIFGFQQALLQAANIVASGNTDTALDKNSSQYLQAVLHQVLSGFIFDESGAADAYILDVVGNNPAPADYEENMTFRFIPTNTNTGASTVDVESLGVKNVFLDGAALTGGEIIIGNTTTITFDVVNDRFNLILLNPASHLHTNAGNGGRLIGRTAQTSTAPDGAVNTGSTTIPVDDTIPQNTEGDQYMSKSITPTKTTNRLVIEFIGFAAHSAAGGNITGALFQDSTADALAVGYVEPTNPNDMSLVHVKHEMEAGTVSPTTFKVRLGGSTAGTLTFNGASGGRLFGGVIASSLTISEIEA